MEIENMTFHLKSLASTIAFATLLALAPAHAQNSITPAEARAIAKEAYIYGYPMVDNYRVIHAYSLDRQNPAYKAPMNTLAHFDRVFTPEDKTVQGPNSDTPYSFVIMDLRAEPMVLTVPPIEKKRYFSIQLIDAYTFNFAYIGSRTTGNDGGNFLVAGPGWKGQTPENVKKVIRSETDLLLAVYRTQLFDPADIENVKKVQAGYKAQPLSQFLGKPAPRAVPANDFIRPLTVEQQESSLQFFNVLNFALQFAPTHPSEKELMARFAKIGVGAGKTIDVDKLSPEMKAALEAGMADAWAEYAALRKRMEQGEVTYGDMFGTRDYLKNNYLYRMAAAYQGIYGNSKEEAIYPYFIIDSDKAKLDGANKYTLRLEPGQLPPVNAFWSLTMYEMPSNLLSANPLNRYLLNSPMLPQFKRDADGGLTFYIQHESPGKDKEANWLPSPKGPFVMAMRLYWPKPEALEDKWKAPQPRRMP